MKFIVGERVSTEAQIDLNLWLITRICALQSILMERFEITAEEIMRLHDQLQAQIDQKQAEIRDAMSLGETESKGQ